ncbi:cytochrome d ubiquinol oxidase subunit II [Oceanobacillus profundus]|uniref:Cytochrome d ubiquinol oxidase subunit II n=1 Tax=Oceanobacillus profundus TaxID=372463 RepID=A0A417YLS8_9BACI|nr:cytochrome d ubiquinol oxidase subunit II [Oceanobacillus profundus]MBR3120633.1 cytochrome d ubiquinol oxidase subunit II [Oceanobacillus sp.]PAE29388.1 cytochrome D ubiquinol oxidase subunit II [Paenibacillus sp. 7884-2]MCM3399284.1 cytochrome d ubiquinol oxidase subunit II [Oceanobacillus profundus]MDO6450360.1 cytochrome d ubiquinol oxidase subunit II [Oceanobacillus profundus]RHW34255.1 cytochrome d ubiquinol oxidase subunit II [Oceanobacillus profundus]
MSLEVLGISVLWLFLFGYVIVGSIDYGAGFFNAQSIITGKQHILSKIIQRYLSPVWEVTNVFFVFFFVGIVGFFPQSAYYFGTILLIPGSIALVLLAIRGSYYAFESYGARGHKGYAFMYGASGLLIPASLSIVLTISEGGFVSIVNDNPVLDYAALFTSPLTWSIVALSIVAVLYISAVFLTWYAYKTGDTKATDLMRKYALGWALPLIITASGIVYELSSHNEAHFERIMDLWWMFALSFILWFATVWLIWKRRNYGMAFWLLVGQFAMAFFAYGVSHYPYLLYPHLTIYEGFTNTAMAISLVFVFILGLALLLPSLYLLLRLFLFDKNYVQGIKNKKE